ncbi:hypothetical protein MTO96_038697 [Rhipicephalus appendiculatus]
MGWCPVAAALLEAGQVGGSTESIRLSGASTSISSGSGTSVGSTDDCGVAMKARNLDAVNTSSNGRRRQAERRCRRRAQKTASQITVAADGR